MFREMPFHVTVDPIEPQRPGVWGTVMVNIYAGDAPIGSYERTYPAFGIQTFAPFEQGGRWYALYSARYTITQVMTLPDCREIGGEPPDRNGFCPVEFYVPCFRSVTLQFPDGETSTVFEWDNRPLDLEETDVRIAEGPWQYLTTGFVAGCHWGDDRSWKIQTIDLSDVANGKITRKATFGYCEVPAGYDLRKSLRFAEFDTRSLWVVHEDFFTLDSGNTQ